MKPILVIMAAGMGSRYGGLKQMDPVGQNNQLIMDYSVYDAKRAGFETVVCILSKAIEADFRETIGRRLEQHMQVRYAIQEITDIPEGFAVPAGRTKPWGTAHAVYSARREIDAPFVVINADDYYGVHAFSAIFQYLTDAQNQENYAMVGYQLQNTVTENGHVSRGVCAMDADGGLLSIVERTRIQCIEGGIAYTEDDGETWQALSEDTVVSMNFWGFPKSFLDNICTELPLFLQGLTVPEKEEFFLPSIVDRMLKDGKARVQVLKTADKWYGVTYRADRDAVVEAFRQMTAQGIYPEDLWA